MGAPRQIRVPSQLPLLSEADLNGPSGARSSETTGTPAKRHGRWLAGYAPALRLGNHPIEELVRRAGYDWLLDLTGWMDRRILLALDDPRTWPDFPRELFERRAKGARPVSPVALFNLVVVGALLGVSSLRELERLAALDLRGMWIMGGWCPDHSTLGRFMAKLHDRVSDKMFEHLTIEALRAVDKRVCDVSLDGTVIAAATSRYGRLKAEGVARRHAEAQAQAQARPDDPKAIAALEKAQACVAALAAQKEIRAAGGRDLESIVIFPSEPDAMLHKTKEGAFHPAFIASATATPDRMIVGIDVNPRDELSSVVPMLNQAIAVSAKVAATQTPDASRGAEENAHDATHDASGVSDVSDVSDVGDVSDVSDAPTPSATRGRESPSTPTHTITVARADALYLAKGVLDLEERLGIELRIAIGSLADSVVAPQGFNPKDPKAFDKYRFRLVVLPATEYASERVCLQCPMGALLHAEGKYPPQRGAPASVRYGAIGVRCAACPYRSQCIEKSKPRTVRRYQGDEAKERMRERMTTRPEHGDRGARAKAIEPCFASIKGPQRLRRFRRRGLRGATLEFCVHALAHNMGRLVFLARRRARACARRPGARRWMPPRPSAPLTRARGRWHAFPCLRRRYSSAPS